MEQLTKAEEKVMRVLWELKKAFVKNVIAEMGEPQPPYNTISSVVRVLESKGFVDHKAYGKTYEYYPLISKGEYKKYTFKKLMGDYFDGSYENLVSFMVQEEQLSSNELEEIKELINSIEPKGGQDE
ncbi:BlaI/MecI/CopY family transcriptional regulator [Flammeovirgaceae bacterium SG7u.111]|nr:BlaI/MecI/CopY family transcriptional regulator [Flammeovirgaceae bacterium SG7u.132]WPO35655.1 BlaI/MecI/CopY family transcriptional regulator [Flammeovirgaceae bacterium SG7u.111]